MSAAVTRSSTRLSLLCCGAIAPPIFVAVALIEGALRPDYDSIRLPISLLGLTDRGWIQTLNFLVFGGLMMAFAVGLSMADASPGTAARLGAILMGLFDIGIVGAGLFTTDPGGGYPPGNHAGASTSGTLHDLATLLVFTCLAAASAAFRRSFAARGEPAWAIYSVSTAGILVLGFALIFAAFSANNDLTVVGGLIQRVTVIAGWSWITLLAVHEIRQGPDQGLTRNGLRQSGAANGSPK